MDDQSSAAASLARRLSTAEGSRPKTADAAGAVAAAEMVQLESLVTMGDGKHDVFTCHCWGLEGTLWAANEPGQLVRTRWLRLVHLGEKLSFATVPHATRTFGYCSVFTTNIIRYTTVYLYDTFSPSTHDRGSTVLEPLAKVITPRNHYCIFVR